MPHSKDKRQRTSSTGESSSSWPNSATSRAERSRHAAKMRRDKEGVEISTLAKLLPYPEEVTSKLDKGSIIRLTTSYLRMKKFTQKEAALLEAVKQKAITSGEEMEGVADEAAAAAASISPPEPPKKESSSEGILMLQALNGFVIFISRKGKIFYISDNVGKHLGVHQYEMIGNSVMEFVHPDDHKELAKQFVVQVPGRVSIKGVGVGGKTKDIPTPMTVNFFDDSIGDDAQIPITDYIQDKQFFLRMRSVMSRRGTGGKGRVVGFRVVNFSGRLKLKKTANQKGYMVEGLVCLCRPIQPQPILEIRMDGNMFMSRHGLDMSFTFCDPRIITLIGYEPHELLGKTAYQFHNPIDAPKVSDCHSKLIKKGSSMSKYYRFISKNGDWVWMQTKATIIYNTNNVAQYVVCMNYVVGNDEGERNLSLEQVPKGEIPPGKDGTCSSVDGSLSPASTSSCPGNSPSCSSSNASNSPAAAAGSAPCSDELEVKMEVMDEPLDVCQFIPEPVRKKEPILKPAPKEESISFAKLLQTDNLKSYLYGDVESMDTSDASSQGASTSTSTNTAGAKAKEPSAVSQSSAPPMQPSTSSSIVPAGNKPPSSPNHGSPSGDSSGSVDSPPTLLDVEESDQVARRQVEDENLFKDLLEMTNNDTEEDLEGGICEGLDSSNYLFTVPSPDNLSQLLGSPSAASLCVESPASQQLSMDDVASPQTPGGQCELPNGILAGLLNCSKAGASDLNPNPSTHTMISMNVTKIDPPPVGDSGLPDDIANFSLDFCRNVMDQSASDIMTSLAKSLDLVESFEDASVIPQPTSSSGATIQELGDVATGGNHQNVMSPQAAVPNPTLQTEPVTPVATPSPRANTPDQNIMLGQNGSKFPIPVGIPLPTDMLDQGGNVSQQAVGSMNVQDPSNVAEGISKLDIEDSQMQQENCETEKRTPLLHALLTGAEANPVAVPPPDSSPGLSQGTPPLQNGVNGVHQDAAVDSFDTFLQEMNTSNSQELDNSSINNNLLNQDDLTLLQQHEQRRLMLMEQQKIQQEKLLEQQMAQQTLLEQNFKEQLLRRKQLQKVMEMKKQMQQQMTLPPVQPGSQQQVGTMFGYPKAGQFTPDQQLDDLGINLAVNGNNGKQQEQLNFPVPNVTAADLQRLQQQKLHQEQVKEQLLLQQHQQQELQQMQQQLAAMQQQEQQQQQPSQGRPMSGQTLLLQQALLQQQQQQQQQVPTSLRQASLLNQGAGASGMTTWANSSS